VSSIDAVGDRPGRAATPGRRASRGPLASESRWAWLFLAPTIIGLAVLSAGPILAALGVSLTKWDMLTPPQVVGLDNYARLLDDDRFLKALRNTTFYTVVSPGSGPPTSCRS
jgi:multiple sugar transport system permease protein